MYGRDAQHISRARRICADWSKHKKPTEAGLLPIPMPRGDERYFWMDMTFAIRGIYFPQCPMAPPPYRDLCTYVRLDFKHRNLDIPFARPYSLDEVPSVYHEEMKYQVERTRLALGPDQTLITVGKGGAEKYGLVDGQSEELKSLYLHPYLRGTPTYSTDIQGQGDKSDFFKNNGAQTQKCKKMMKSWLTASDKVPATKDQEARLQKMKDFASKNGLTRTHDHARLEITSIKGDPEKMSEWNKIKELALDEAELLNLGSLDSQEGPRMPTPFSSRCGWVTREVAVMTKVQYAKQEDDLICPLSVVMTSPDHDPDALIGGTLHFDTTTEWGLDIHPQVTLRFDVKGLQTLLAIPSAYRRPESANQDGEPIPLDVYKQNLVLAFGAEDINMVDSTKKEGYNWECSMNEAINYTTIVKGEFGLNMQYVPADRSIWEHIANFAIQVIAVLADLIPVIGPFLSVAIYIGGNCILDAAWGENWDNSAPAVIACIVSSRANLGKWTVSSANKVNKLRIGA